jgi:hypothetical protein
MTNEANTAENTATAADQTATGATKKVVSKKAPAPKKGAPKATPKGKKTTKASKATKQAIAKTAAKPAAKKDGATLRPGSKGAKILELISRPKGATTAELMKAAGWQPQSVRGFISGALGKKLGIKVESAKREDGERVYTAGK